MLLVKLGQSRPRILGKAHFHPPFARGDKVENEHESRQKHRSKHHEHEQDWCELPHGEEGMEIKVNAKPVREKTIGTRRKKIVYYLVYKNANEKSNRDPAIHSCFHNVCLCSWRHGCEVFQCVSTEGTVISAY